MSEEQLVESSAAPEVQAQAEKMGWIPPSRFRGDPERFVDADLYIERGETVLPIVKEHNRRLERELEDLRGQNAKVTEALGKAQKAIDEIEERHTVATQKAVEQARKDVKAQIAAASEAGDHEAVAELTDQLGELRDAEKAAKAKPVVKEEPPKKDTPPAIPPEIAKAVEEWNKDNPWFGKDKRRTALAISIAQELREGGETSQGREFFDKMTAEVESYLGAPVQGSKVEGARNGSEADSRVTGGKGFNALPADAKAACDKDADQFVGPNKTYKTLAEWRTRYAQIYFE